MPTNLPNPLPAGTVAFVPDGEPRKANHHDIVLGEDGQFYEHTGWPNDKPRQVYTRHVLTAPLHHLTPPAAKEPTVRERLKDYCADPSATDLLFAASLDSILARLDKAGI